MNDSPDPHPTADHACERGSPVRRSVGHRGPIVIAHRGASGYRPEHTLEGYRLAIRQGADFIEPDLVATSDGVLVARHDNEISTTTDVAAHAGFASRRATKIIDGAVVTGWFTEDFTLAELRTLRAKERLPGLRPANVRFDGMYAIPTFAEILRLAQRESRDGRVVGVYPETKHPTYFVREGRRLDGGAIAISLGALLVDTLVAEGFTDPERIFIQSFEVENLIELKSRLMPLAGIDLPLVQLLGDLDTATPYDIVFNLRHGADLSEVYCGLQAQVDGGLGTHTRYAALASASVLSWMRGCYADGIGPWKRNLAGAGAEQQRRSPSDGKAESIAGHKAGSAHTMLTDALDAGLLVHPYTLRAEEGYTGHAADGAPLSVIDEAVQLFGLGVQGIFIDQPDLGVAARNIFLGGDTNAAY